MSSGCASSGPPSVSVSVCCATLASRLFRVAETELMFHVGELHARKLITLLFTARQSKCCEDAVRPRWVIYTPCSSFLTEG